VLLDISMPEMDGLAVLARLRETGTLPVILLTARDAEDDRIRGLDLGADDYVVKPFSPRELAARVRSLLRRARAAGPAGVLEFEGLRIDLGARDVSVGGEPAGLTRREFDVLATLASAPRQAFSRAQLLRRVWGSQEAWQTPATVTEHVRRLRRKIESDPERPRWVQTVQRVGYRFEPGAPPTPAGERA
jgi:DNA-binding response OmpR family regulator